MSAILPEELDILMTAARDYDDRQAYADIVDACHHLVRATILRETADPELADEIAQEVFVRGWTRRKQYRPGTNPRAWLLSIARNQLMEYHRRNSRDNRHLRELIRREILRRADQFEPATSHPDSERLAALKECMLSLSDDQRELLDLVHGKGLQTSDAAEIMGVSPPTCRQRLSRLQRMLRECALKRLGEPA